MTRKLIRILLLPAILFLSVGLLHAQAYRTAGYDRLSLWDTEGAMESAEKAIKENPQDAKSYELMGFAYFYSGNYAEAIKHISKACDLDPYNMYRKNLLAFVKGTGDILKPYEEHESEHFILRVHPRDRILKYYVLDALEKGYRKIGNMLGFKAGRKIIAEIYSRREDFNFASTLTKEQIEASGAIGICKFNRNMIVSPRCLAFGFRWLDSIVHELTHYMILHTASSDIPLWLNEGIARYFETTWRSEESLYLVPVVKNLLKEAVEDNQWVEFEKMKNGMPNLDNKKEVSMAFAEVGAGVDYIISTYGSNKLASLVREFMDNKNENNAFKKILGVSSIKFLKELKQFIRDKNLQATEGAVLDNFKLKDENVNETNEYVGVEARGYVRLGNKFRKKKMYPVALIEYAKALELDPVNPVILNKIGKTYFDLGEFESAEENLKKSLEYNPNSANTHTNLGDLLFSRNRLEEALNSYVKSNHINPFNPAIHKSMGLIHFNLGNKEEAVREFKVTGMLAPYDTEIQGWLLNLKRKNENTEQAE